MTHFELHISRPNIAALTGALAVSAAMGGCATPGAPDRPGSSLGQPSASNAPGPQRPKAPARKTARRYDLDRDYITPLPSRTLPIPGSGPNPTALGPRGVLPDPYAYPQ